MVANVPVLFTNLLSKMGVIGTNTHIDLDTDVNGPGAATTLNAMTLRFENHQVSPATPKANTSVQSVNLVAMANERNRQIGRTAQHTPNSNTFLADDSPQFGSFKVPDLHLDEHHYRDMRKVVPIGDEHSYTSP